MRNIRSLTLSFLVTLSLLANEETEFPQSDEKYKILEKKLEVLTHYIEQVHTHLQQEEQSLENRLLWYKRLNESSLISSDQKKEFQTVIIRYIQQLPGAIGKKELSKIDALRVCLVAEEFNRFEQKQKRNHSLEHVLTACQDFIHSYQQKEPNNNNNSKE